MTEKNGLLGMTASEESSRGRGRFVTNSFQPSALSFQFEKITALTCGASQEKKTVAQVSLHIKMPQNLKKSNLWGVFFEGNGR